MTNCIAVGLGGFIGATLRYLIGLIPVCETTLFPVKTFFINIAGCIAIALVAMLATKGSISNPKLGGEWEFSRRIWIFMELNSKGLTF